MTALAILLAAFYAALLLTAAVTYALGGAES